MKYSKLGNTDISVSRLCVGCMSFGKPSADFHEWTLNPEDTEEIVKKALSLGINFFDTANVYSHGTSEEYLGRALRNNVKRSDVVIATKVYFNEGNLSQKAILREIDASLSRLGTDYVDLYIIHRFDYSTPIEETMEALDSLIKAGKVRAIGASAMYGYQFYNMQLAAEKTAGISLFPCKITTIFFIVRTKESCSRYAGSCRSPLLHTALWQREDSLARSGKRTPRGVSPTARRQSNTTVPKTVTTA